MPGLIRGILVSHPVYFLHLPVLGMPRSVPFLPSTQLAASSSVFV